MLRIVFFLFILSFSFFNNIKAQNQWWYGNFTQITDNREYFSKNFMQYSQTILGSRINAGSGFKVDSLQNLYVGLNYMYEYGGKLNALTPIPDLYYKFENANSRMFFGSFSRNNLLNYPLALITDSIGYYRPNIQGGLLELRGNWGYQNAWCDWISRQSSTANEVFMAGSSGHFQHSIFYIENYFYMYHHAGTMNKADTTFHLRDNGGGALYAGIDLAKFTKFDILTFDIGRVGSYDRYRPQPYKLNSGFQCRVNVFYKYAGVNATYYKGNSLSVANGDAFYQSGNYSRIDTYIKFVKTKKVNSKLAWCFHLVNGELNNSIQLFVWVNFWDRK